MARSPTEQHCSVRRSTRPARVPDATPGGDAAVDSPVDLFSSEIGTCETTRPVIAGEHEPM
jgi:hypothetical protein